MIKVNSKTLNWRNGLILSAISYLLYLVIWFILEDDANEPFSTMSPAEYTTDFLLCMLFTYISLGFCYLVFKVLPFKGSYVRVVLYASMLLLLNNAVAFGMISLFEYIWGTSGDPLSDALMNMKGTYTFAMIATFLSSVYANSFYLQSYIKARDEKQALELALMKEKETALQFQLNSLKLQINPHFLFNNFSTLSDLIETDREQAEKFLSHLSKVYRHILRNLNRDLICVADEIVFLESYISLMKLRHGKGLIINIDDRLKKCSASIPPASLQLLVENAIKHNSHTSDKPLFIDVSLTDDKYVNVRNIKTPLKSEVRSTGLGQQNIIERYKLLCESVIKIEDSEHFYSVSLPLINNSNRI